MGKPKRFKRAKQPARLNPEVEKLRNLLQTIDKLREAGFIQHHLFINDSHQIKFTDRGRAIVQAVQELETALPKLSAGERTGLWHLLRMVEWPHGNPDQTAPLTLPSAANRDDAASSRQLADPPPVPAMTDV